MGVPLDKGPAVVAQLFNRPCNFGRLYKIDHTQISFIMHQLTHYRVLFVCALSMCAISLMAGSLPDYSNYKRLLKTYVVREQVNYEAWVENGEDVAALETFVENLSNTDIELLSKADQAAFYINLYNAVMLQVVLEKYPIDSVKQIGMLPFSIFKKNRVQIKNHKVSLDDIEKRILLKKYFDPRIHFAVNCASESCPPLRAEPFIGDLLDQQLEEQTRLFARSSRAARANKSKKSIAYSELFKWYASDFGTDNPAQYLNPYRSVPLPVDYTVAWIPYDWSLNEIKEEKGQ